MKRILRFLKGTINTQLVLGRRSHYTGEEVATSAIAGYFDSAYMDDKVDRHSIMAYVFFCAGSLVS